MLNASPRQEWLRERASMLRLYVHCLASLISILIAAHFLLSYNLLSPSLFYLLPHSRCRGCLFSLEHTQTHTTVGRTPLDEGSAHCRDLYLTTHKHSQKTNIHAPVRIRTHYPSKRSAADLLDRAATGIGLVEQTWI
jgi:hypothetical protein